MENKIYIDRRSLIYLFLLEYRKAFILAFIVMIFILLMTAIEPFEGLNIAAWRALCVFLLCISLWVLDVIPKAITGILAIVLIPTFNILPDSVSYSLFGDKAIFFILGAFLIAAAYSNSGLDKRLSIFVLQKLATNTEKLLLTILFFAAFLSLWMPEHAVAALLFPIVIEMSSYISSPEKKKYTTGMLFALIWGCCIGGVGTFLGGARNPLAVSLLEELSGESISFIEWMIAVMPFVIMALIVSSIIIIRFFSINFDMNSLQKKMLNERVWLGKTTFKEYMVAIIIIMTVFCWMFLGQKLGITNIALISAVLFFVLKLVDWKTASSFIHWDILLMYGGAISLGSALHKTGAVQWLANNYFSNLDTSPLVIVIVIAFISMLLTEAISNVAVVILILPIAINIAVINNIDLKLMTLSVTVPSGLAFMLPLGNPPNAICYSSGIYKMSDSIKLGALMNLYALILFIVTIIFYWPILGLNY